MHDGPEEGEGDEENVQEGPGQGVRAGGLQEVLYQWNGEDVKMQLQAQKLAGWVEEDEESGYSKE